MHHLVIVEIQLLVKMQHMLIPPVHISLVKDAQNLLEPVVNLAVQPGNLYDDAVVGEAVYEWVWQPLGHQVVVIVIRIPPHIEHRLLYVAHLMSKQVNRNHRDGIAFLALWQYVFRIGIVHTQVLPETQRLGFKPSLLQLYQNKVERAVALTNRGSEVYAEDGEVLAVTVTVLITAHLHIHNLFFQQSRENGLGDALVLHEVLENNIVNGICYCHTGIPLISECKVKHFFCYPPNFQVKMCFVPAAP